jgi:hypothetical protein
MVLAMTASTLAASAPTLPARMSLTALMMPQPARPRWLRQLRALHLPQMCARAGRGGVVPGWWRVPWPALRAHGEGRRWAGRGEAREGRSPGTGSGAALSGRLDYLPYSGTE